MQLRNLLVLPVITLMLLTGEGIKNASAHSGRTNSSGCHNNRSTGDYHCHNSGRLSNPIRRPDPRPRPVSRPTPPSTQSSWTVLSVGDGDTLRITRNEETITVRLACIDAPEMAQDYGPIAKQRLQELLPVNTPVSLRTVDTDGYGRTVAELLSQGTNINLSLIESGHAVAYRDYLSNCDRTTYLKAEATARENNLVFWSEPTPEMPWDFRRR